MTTNKRDQFLTIREQVLGEIRPTPDEIKGIRQVAETLEKSIKKLAQSAKVPISFFEIEGSTGIKQTQLRNTSDIDAFIGLPLAFLLPGGRQQAKIHHKDLEPILSQMVTTWLKSAVQAAGATSIEISYAEHPYLSAKIGSYDVDVILCIDVPENDLLQNGPITAMDRTPWHSRYLDRALSPEQKDDVRLLKQFIKACHAYGDASAPGQIGFIGFALELLVQHIGSFWDVLEQFPTLPQRTFDPFKRSSNALRKIQRFQKDFLLIIDPTDRNRNVAAAISARAYRWVNARISDFIKAPSPDFFLVKPIPEVKDCPPEFKVVEFHALNNIHYTIVRDKIYSWASVTLKNARLETTGEPRFLKPTFELYFQPGNMEYALAFWTKTPHISEQYLRQGPPARKKNLSSSDKQEPPDAKKFLEKYSDAFEQDGFYCIWQKRDFTSFESFLASQLQQRPIADSITPVNLPHLTPTTSLGQRSLFVLREMVLPYEGIKE